MTKDIQSSEPKKDEDSIPDGLVGCAVVGGPAALIGLKHGAKYGYDTGKTGAWGRGPFNAFVKIGATTALGALGGAAVYGGLGCAAGYAGEEFVIPAFDEHTPIAPQPNLPRLKPMIPENQR